MFYKWMSIIMFLMNSSKKRIYFTKIPIDIRKKDVPNDLRFKLQLVNKLKQCFKIDKKRMAYLFGWIVDH